MFSFIKCIFEDISYWSTSFDSLCYGSKGLCHEILFTSGFLHPKHIPIGGQGFSKLGSARLLVNSNGYKEIVYFLFKISIAEFDGSNAFKGLKFHYI